MRREARGGEEGRRVVRRPLLPQTRVAFPGGARRLWVWIEDTDGAGTRTLQVQGFDTSGGVDKTVGIQASLGLEDTIRKDPLGGCRMARGLRQDLIRA